VLVVPAVIFAAAAGGRAGAGARARWRRRAGWAALAAGCLLALAKQRWLIAGLCAALASATRPSWLALALACTVAAGLVLRREPRAVLAVLLAFTPILLANIIFSQRFRDTSDSAVAFGANLLGAMIGGLLFAALDNEGRPSLRWRTTHGAGPLRRRAAHEALEAVGLAEDKRKFPVELSLGERQRVAVARTLALRPRLLLADEPTASLDERNASVVMELLSHAACEGALVVVATHHLDFRAAQVVSLPRIPITPKKLRRALPLRPRRKSK